MINPRLLDAFTAVVRTGSTVAAARSLNTSQPSISRAIADLEHQIDLTLFSRSRGRMRLTREGEYFFAEVDRFFAGTSELLDKAREIRNFEDTVLRIASIAAAALQTVPDALEALVGKVGDIRTSYQMRSHYKTVDLVRTGRVDVGICNAVTPDMAVTICEQFELRCLLAIPVGHRLCDSDRVSIRQLQGEQLISLGPEFNAQHIDDADALAFLESITRRTVNLSLPACRQVACGLGVAIIDPMTARFHRALGIEVRALEPRVRYPVTIVEAGASAKSKLNDSFVDLVASEIRNAETWAADPR